MLCEIDKDLNCEDLERSPIDFYRHAQEVTLTFSGFWVLARRSSEYCGTFGGWGCEQMDGKLISLRQMLGKKVLQWQHYPASYQFLPIE